MSHLCERSNVQKYAELLNALFKVVVTAHVEPIARGVAAHVLRLGSARVGVNLQEGREQRVHGFVLRGGAIRRHWASRDGEGAHEMEKEEARRDIYSEKGKTGRFHTTRGAVYSKKTSTSELLRVSQKHENTR